MERRRPHVRTAHPIALTGITERDPAGQITGQIAYAYDAKGRLTFDTRTVAGIAYSTAYRYDSSGRRDRITYPSGRTVDFSFDTLGRVNGVTSTPLGGSAQTLASGIAYQPFGNGQTYERVYDQDGRISAYTLGGTQYSVGYDAASRINLIAEAANPPNTNTYGYDALDRLTSATLPLTSYGYTYDAVGNRQTRIAGASTDTYAYSPTSNRLASITPPSGPIRSFTFDPNGSTTADGNNTYAYDVRGRMVSATSSIGTTTYQVKALGQRVRKTNSLGDRVFHYDDQGHLIAESTAAGALLKEYVWLNDMPLAGIDSSEYRYIHVDHLNTPRLVAHSTGTTLWRWDQQEPFGNNVPDENPSGLGVFDQPLRLPGQYFDKETNLHYNYYRDYDPSIGRYGESDPIGLDGGLNTYAYVEGNPLILSDEFGLDWGICCPDGRKPKTSDDEDRVGGSHDFARNYHHMRRWKQSDKYFHCKANCEAAQRGPAGYAQSTRLGGFREFTDQLRGDSPEDSAGDEAANSHGREAGKRTPCADCRQICRPYRPRRLPPRY